MPASRRAGKGCFAHNGPDPFLPPDPFSLPFSPPSAKRLDSAKAQFISAMNRTDEYVWVWYHGSLFPANNIPAFAGFYAKNTDAYIQALVDFTGLARATTSGRYRTLAYWRMEEGKGSVTADLSGLGFRASLSNPDIWTEDTPRLPKVTKNNSALDFRANRHYLTADGFGHNGGSVGYRRSSHLGNLYFTDHTIEFSFRWDGKVTTKPQHLYGADGGKDKSGRAHTFAYGGRIPAGSRKLVHWLAGSVSPTGHVYILRIAGAKRYWRRRSAVTMPSLGRARSPAEDRMGNPPLETLPCRLIGCVSPIMPRGASGIRRRTWCSTDECGCWAVTSTIR